MEGAENKENSFNYSRSVIIIPAPVNYYSRSDILDKAFRHLGLELYGEYREVQNSFG